jgi:hypothetical protein
MIRIVKEHSGGRYVCGKIYLPKELIGKKVSVEVVE